MSFELHHTALFLSLVLFIIYFNGGAAITKPRETTTALGGRSKSLLFNVKSFGARADGTTDDTKVCALPIL